MADRESFSEVVPRRRPWGLLIGLLVVVLGVTVLIVRALRAPMPLRVLIAIDLDGKWWEGSQPAAIVADRVAARLTKLGFEPVRAGDPDVVRTLERARTPEEAARKLHAAFVVTADIAPAIIEHKLPKGAYYETRAEAPIFVQELSGKRVQAGSIATFGGARERPGALENLAIGLADQAFDAIVVALIGAESVKELLADRQSNVAPQIYPARDFVAARGKAIKDANDAWEAVRKKHLEQEGAGDKPVYLSVPSALDELSAVGPSGALVATNGVRPWFSPDSKTLGWINELETLEWRPIDGAARGIFRGYNLYGYPHAVGDRAVLIEDLFGWAKTITVIDGAKSRRVRIDPEHRFVEPRLSPDGKRIAVWDRPSPTEAGALLVVSAESGDTLLEVDRERGHFDGFAWADRDALAFLHTGVPAEGDDARRLVTDDPKLLQGLYFVDFTAVPPAIGRGRAVPEGEVWAMPAAHGDLLALERRDGAPAIALYRRSDATITNKAVPGLARAPSFSPDGKWLTFSLDDEIAIAEIAGGAPKKLTRNPFRDRYPQFSADQKHIFYETIDDDPNYPSRRRLVWIAAVAVP